MSSLTKEIATAPPANPAAFGVVLSGEEAHIRNVYVASLPAAFTDAELAALFSPFGKIVSCKMFNNDDRPSSQGRAYGFVMFEQPEGAERAIEGLMGAVVGSQRIQVRRAKPPGSRAPPPGYTPQVPTVASSSSTFPAPGAPHAMPIMPMPQMMQPYGFASYAVDPATGMAVPIAMPPQPMMMSNSAAPIFMPYGGMPAWGYGAPQTAMGGQMVFMPQPMHQAPVMGVHQTTMSTAADPVIAQDSAADAVSSYTHQTSVHQF